MTNFQYNKLLLKPLRLPEPSVIVSIVRRRFSAVLEQEGRWYTALCPELDVASQGKTIDQALRNLRQAVELYLDTASPAELKGLGTSQLLITTLEVRS